MQERPFKQFLQHLSGDGEEASRRRANLILLCGMLGMAILFCTQMFPADHTPASAESTLSQRADAPLEERLGKVVANIDGVGRSRVMVTFESGVENIYAKEERRTTDRYEDTADGSSLQQKENTETSYILVDGGAGKKQALVEKQIEPVVRGVVVLCEGADDPIVERRVTEAVRTALGVSTSRICVIKISS